MARLAAVNPAVKTLDESAARAKMAERLGYESVWTNQLPYERDASVVLAAYAANTSTIKLGTAVLPIYTRHPTASVQMAASLDELSGGRFILGIGISHKVTVEGMWGLHLVSPVDAMREYLTIVRTSLRERGCDFEGRHFTARWRYAGPTNPNMPVMISALSPRMLELAGEMADGVVLWMCTPRYIQEQVIPILTAGRAKAGKSYEGFEVVAAVPVSLTSNRERALGVFRQTVNTYARLPYYRKALDAVGFKAELDTGNPSDALLDELAGIGDEEQVTGVIKRYRQAGVTLPAVGPFAGHEGAKGYEATLEAAASA